MIKVLVVEDNLGDILLLEDMLLDVPLIKFELEKAHCLSAALERLLKGGIDVVLLDLTLPDSIGIETFALLRQRIPDVPVVILTGLDDESLAKEAVRQGVQDYLVKGHINSKALERSLVYAIERQRLHEEILTLSLVDELTGLYNRRGLFTLGRQQMKVAIVMQKNLCVLFIDLNRMKWINDSFGHLSGDSALRAAADILRDTFRDADIISRFGGDEFVILALDILPANIQIILNRLKTNLDKINSLPNRQFQLSFSIGYVHFDPSNPLSLNELIDRADKLMYEHKMLNKKLRSESI